ncbi:hypothetical protein [Microbacterium sp. SMR1]|uniref:hypothetical protein n=1 Tax=Microbacterium sp. SMR1 TaxID=1497340 RepID=UPI0015EC854B|nr:hypothetical protein [Microbacterium sp. SMR1]
MMPHDELESGEQPNCDLCGTVMRTADGAFECGYCGYSVDIPWVERASADDEARGIRGG